MKGHSVVLAGFGNIGQALAEQIEQQHPASTNLTITGVSDARFGTVVHSAGLDPQRLLGAVREDASFTDLEGIMPDGDVYDAIDHAEADTLVELTFTDLETGEPATSHIRHALRQGMNVSTTNKGPIALHLDELYKSAEENDVVLAFEGTVMSGTPAILLAEHSIKEAGFRGAVGILNGTTNYVITRMEEGATYEHALAEAQDLGYAEADPSGDVDGHDAAGKLSILARLLLDQTIPPSSVRRTPLSTLTEEQVVTARASGTRWRYVAALEQSGGPWQAIVAPRQLDDAHPLSSVMGATNALTFHTESLGDVTLVGPGAGRTETAYAVLRDLKRISQASRS